MAAPRPIITQRQPTLLERLAPQLIQMGAQRASDKRMADIQTQKLEAEAADLQARRDYDPSKHTKKIEGEQYYQEYGGDWKPVKDRGESNIEGYYDRDKAEYLEKHGNLEGFPSSFLEYRQTYPGGGPSTTVNVGQMGYKEKLAAQTDEYFRKRLRGGGIEAEVIKSFTENPNREDAMNWTYNTTSEQQHLDISRGIHKRLSQEVKNGEVVTPKPNEKTGFVEYYVPSKVKPIYIYRP